MNKNRRALTALLAMAAMGGASIALAQALPAITEGGPPQPLHVPAMPLATFTVATPGEFQIDAMGGTADAQLVLLSGESTVAQDADSGDGVDARIVAFLAPGAYGVRVYEWQGRAMSARVGVTALAPMTAVASIAPGAPPAVVSVPAGSSPREGSVEVTLTVAAAGNFRLDAVTADSSIDPELMLIQAGALLASDSDSGDGTNAQIVHQLAPGVYTLRVRDWINRAGTITVSAVAQ